MQDVTSWGTTATQNTVSWIHCDDKGFSTLIWVQCGGKCNLWELEAVYLVPNTVFFMRSCTPHFVLSTEGTVMLGHHYISVSTIRHTCYGLVNTFVMGVGITNTSHDTATCCMLRQLMALWYRHLILGNNFEESFQLTIITVPHGHVPDMKTQDDLLDVITLGCVLEFTTALRSDRYGDDYNPSSDLVASDLEQENLARTWFRVIMKTLASRFFTVIEGTIVHTSYIWESVLVGFAAAVVRHMKSKQKVVEQVHSRGPKEVATALSLHLELDHLHLIELYIKAKAEKPP
ncbi:hypothetical protein FIBSPDRAFT_891401 [Athelia psychrophila]|uniref:JmjC domain-containing protein n=1 Tax=Athelia psychrophila TaxID=1759441 RepID=A0A166JM10_9AGAM|nr:hypothetical protein FIBSPDRAFT_891401 [Fibularhizoctonia sp. CBS 109695]